MKMTGGLISLFHLLCFLVGPSSWVPVLMNLVVVGLVVIGMTQNVMSTLPAILVVMERQIFCCAT